MGYGGYGGDVFCHVSAVTDGDMLREGDLVEYKECMDDPRGPRAVDVTGGFYTNAGDAQTVRKLKRKAGAGPHTLPCRSPHQHHAPGVGLEGKGYWVLIEAFEGRKSFGCFRCGGCGNMWSSAHAFPNFKQGCKSCERESYPCCLWLNLPSDDDVGETRTVAVGGEQHDTARCEACRRGECSLYRHVRQRV